MKRKSGLLSLVVSLVLMAFATQSQAGYTTQGVVTAVLYMPGGVVMFHTNATHISPPGCHSSTTRWAIAASEKAQISGLLLAYAQGKKIDISGTASCAAWGDTESVSYFTSN